MNWNRKGMIGLTALALACGGWGSGAAAQQAAGYFGGGLNLNVSYGTFLFGTHTMIGSGRLFGSGFGARVALDFMFTPQIVLGTALEAYAVIPTGSLVTVNAGAGLSFYFVPALYLAPHALLGLDFRLSRTISAYVDLTPGLIFGLDNDQGLAFTMNVRFGTKLRF